MRRLARGRGSGDRTRGRPRRDRGGAGRSAAASWNEIAALCAIDSASDAPWGRERVAGYLAAWAEQAGCVVERVATAQGAALVARLDAGTPAPSREPAPLIALVGHHDRVPIGSALLRGSRHATAGSSAPAPPT